MSDFNRTGLTAEQPPRRRSASSRFGDLGERLSRTFSGVERGRRELPVWDTAELGYADDQDHTVAWGPGGQRFASVVQGYDPDAVDEHLDGLERELAELRSQRSERTSVTAEFDRIGDQTAAILRTAYEQAKEITREAKEQAEKCVQDAAANAVSITEDANKRLRQIDVDTDAVWQERSRMIEDARAVARELLSLAESAMKRFPEEHEKTEHRIGSPAVPASATETDEPAVVSDEPEPASAGQESQPAPATPPRPFGVTAPPGGHTSAARAARSSLPRTP